MRICILLAFVLTGFSTWAQESTATKVCEIVRERPGVSVELILGEQKVFVVGYEHGTANSRGGIAMAVDQALKDLDAGKSCNSVVSNVLAVTDSESRYTVAQKFAYETLVGFDSFEPEFIGIEAAYEEAPRNMELSRLLDERAKTFTSKCGQQGSIFEYFLRLGLAQSSYLYSQKMGIPAIGIEHLGVRTEGGKFFPLKDQIANSDLSAELKDLIIATGYRWLFNRQVVMKEGLELKELIESPELKNLYGRFVTSIIYLILRDAEMAKSIIRQQKNGVVLVGALHLEPVRDELLAACRIPKVEPQPLKAQSSR